MKVGVVGSGAVGSAAAYAMVLRGSASEVVLVDSRAEKAAAEAEDIAHAVPFTSRTRVRAGDYADLGGSALVVLAAGVQQGPGEDRPALLERNAVIVQQVVPRVLGHAPESIMVVATNPVDAITVVAGDIRRGSGLATTSVFGTGTMLDTARLRQAVARHFRVDAQHVHGYVVGEHGDSEVVVWSGLTVSAMPASEMATILGVEWNEDVCRRLDDDVIGAAQRIIAGKGATAFGIGAVIARIVEVVLRDQRAILTVTAFDKEFGCALSLPRLVDGTGVTRTIGARMNDDERRRLDASAALLREHIAGLSRMERRG